MIKSIAIAFLSLSGILSMCGPLKPMNWQEANDVAKAMPCKYAYVAVHGSGYAAVCFDLQGSELFRVE